MGVSCLRFCISLGHGKLKVMPQLSGIFSLFTDLDTITASEVIEMGQQQYEHHMVENHLANRILYPQSVAATRQELDLDFLLLTQAIRRHPEVFFDAKQNRIIIPQIAADQLPPLTRLISVILHNIPYQNITDIWLKTATDQSLLGSCIPASLISSMNISGEIKMTVQGDIKTLIPNQLNLIPVKDRHIKIQFNQEHTLTAVGGSLGLFVDLRERKI